MAKSTNKPRLMRALLLTVLLSAGACAPVYAQAVNPGAAAPPVAATTPVPWNSLSSDQQRLLSRMSGQWSQLPPQRQQALASGSQRWLGMSADQRTQARQRFNQWQKLPQQRRDLLRKRWEDFRSLPPAQQQADRDNYRKFQKLPQERRQQLRQRWQSATPAQRQNMVQRARQRRGQRAKPR